MFFHKFSMYVEYRHILEPPLADRHFFLSSLKGFSH